MQPTYRRKLQQVKPKELLITQYKHEELQDLNSCFEQTDWDMFIKNSADIDELTDTITSYIRFNSDMILTKKKIKIYGNNKPWINSSLRKQIVYKHRAFSENSPNAAMIQLSVNKAIFDAKKSFKTKVENMFKNNQMKDAWQGLRLLTGSGKIRSEIALTNTPGSADRLNEFYARFDSSDHSYEREQLKQKLIQTALNEDEISITENEVFTAFRNICTKKASGPDKISGNIIKNCASSLCSIFYYIFNTSISIGKFPSLWKTGEIIPVNKKPFPKVDNDLRPVTLTAIIAKCFERIMLPKIMSFVKPSMDHLQFAYIANRCTEDAVNFFIHELLQHLEHPATSARCLFIDYSSAFNTMQPHILVKKLASYNVPAKLQLWTLDFLTERSQYVRTSSEISNTIKINTGAPQGCVLSAFLFIMYTNDMCLNSPDCKIIKYADDTVILGLVKDNDDSDYLETVSYVADWCKDNCLDLNVTKTKEMLFDFRRNKPEVTNIQIDNSEVECVKSYKYLGVNIESNVKWDSHVHSQIKKANQRLYFVRCLRRLSVDVRLINLCYNSLISSVLLYAVSVWFESCGEGLRKDTVKIRKKAERIVGTNDGLLIEPRVAHKNKCIALLNKISSDDTHPLFKYFRMLPHGNRYSSIQCRTTRFKNSFIPTCIRLYNQTLCN